MKPEVRITVDHELKILPEYFKEVADHTKTFEIRKNDRNFERGDFVLLREYEEGRYSGRNILAEITYITDYEQKEGYVVFGIKAFKLITWVD